MTNQELLQEFDRLIPQDVDILHEIATDRVLCSRQAIVNFLDTALTKARQSGRDEAVAHVAKHIVEIETDERTTGWTRDYSKVLMEARTPSGGRD